MTDKVGSLAIGLVGLAVAVKVAAKFTDSLVEKVGKQKGGNKIKW